LQSVHLFQHDSTCTHAQHEESTAGAARTSCTSSYLAASTPSQLASHDVRCCTLLQQFIRCNTSMCDVYHLTELMITPHSERLRQETVGVQHERYIKPKATNNLQFKWVQEHLPVLRTPPLPRVWRRYLPSVPQAPLSLPARYPTPPSEMMTRSCAKSSNATPSKENFPPVPSRRPLKMLPLPCLPPLAKAHLTLRTIFSVALTPI